MSEQEHCELNALCDERFQSLRADMASLGMKMDDICTLLKGDNAGRPGLVARLASVEKDVQSAKEAGGSVLKMILQPAIAAAIGAVAVWLGFRK